MATAGEFASSRTEADVSFSDDSSRLTHPTMSGEPSSERSPSRWFDTSAFVIPERGTFGNSGRGILTGPGVNNLDITLMKNTRLGEKMNLQFRAEAFNALNHPNFFLPVLEVTSPAFGTLTRAKDARQIQLGLKLYY